MKDIICYKLRFTAPLHLGTAWEGYEDLDDVLHSDTLFSAIMNVFPSLFDDDIENLCMNPPFLCSSAFPFYRNRYFFPRPMLPLIREKSDLNAPAAFKKLKRIRYLEKGIFERVLRGERFDADSINISAYGKLWLESPAESQNIKIFDVRETPRIVKDRIHDSTTIFYFSQMSFAKNAGFFFLCKYLNMDFRQKTEAVLRLLGDEGLGADRSVGKGNFVLEIDDSFTLSVPESSERFTSLSLFHPRREDIAGGILKNPAYDIVERGGWSTSPEMPMVWKGRVRMFSEGSVFSGNPEKSYGDIVRLMEKGGIAKHSIFRNGMAFTLPCISKGDAQ